MDERSSTAAQDPLRAEYWWCEVPGPNVHCRFLVDLKGEVLGRIDLAYEGERFAHTVTMFGPVDNRHFLDLKEAEEYAVSCVPQIVRHDALRDQVAYLEKRVAVLQAECQRLEQRANQIQEFLRSTNGGVIFLQPR